MRWQPRGADEEIEVACFDRGYVYAADPLAGRQDTASAWSRRTGAVTRTGTGRYRADVPPQSTAAQVTPVGTAARHCAVTGLGGGVASIACADPAGAPADTAFVLSHTGGRSLLDDGRVPHGVSLVVSDSPAAAAPTVAAPWMSRSGTPTVARTGVGRYTVRFTVGYLTSYTHVTATGGGYCSVMLRNDYGRKDDVYLSVACFTAAGAPSNGGFLVTCMTASPQYP